MTRSIRRVCLMAALFGLVAVVTPAQAAPLADRVPADALVYLGWSGADSMGPGYEGSHLKAVLTASQFGKLMDEAVPQLMKKLQQADPQASEIVKQVLAVAAPMWHHPTAFYFGGVDFGGQTPMPKVAVLCQAGTDGAELVKQINELLDQAPKGEFPLPVCKQYGDLVVVAFGDAAAVDGMFAKAPAKNLAGVEHFKQAMAQVTTDPVMAAYVDVDAILKQIDDTMAKMSADEQITTKWDTIKKSIGLTTVHRMALGSGFDGRDWADQAFISTSEGANPFDAKPLDADLLKVVPQSASRMAAMQFDIGKAVESIRSAVSQLDAGTNDQVSQVFEKINDAIGMDVQKDFIDLLGQQWVTYSDRSVGGNGMLGSVVVNKLKDPAKFDAASKTVVQKLNEFVAEQMHEPGVSIKIVDTTENGVTMHYLAVPMVSPCWAVKDGYLFVGLYPQVVAAAVDQVTSKGPSILERAEYKALMKRLGDKPATAVDFVDLPTTAPDGYSNLLMGTRYVLGMADVFGTLTPAMTVPRLSKIMPELTPAGGVSWSDELGWHYKGISPFPGASLFAGTTPGAALAVAAPVAGFGMVWARAERQAVYTRAVMQMPVPNQPNQAVLDHEKQIGQAVLAYARDRGKFPETIGQAAVAGKLDPKVCLSVSQPVAVPGNYDGMTDAEKAEWIDENCGFVYMGKDLDPKTVKADRVILHESPNPFSQDGTPRHNLFADGHVAYDNSVMAVPVEELHLPPVQIAPR